MTIQTNTAGAQVVIPTNLTTDPANRQGEYGKIVKVDGETVTVRFSDGATAKYQADAIDYVTADELYTEDGVAKGGFSLEVFNSPSFQTYQGGYGAIYHGLRTYRRDEILEQELRKQGLSPREIGAFLTGKTGRWAMDCFSISEKDLRFNIAGLVHIFKQTLFQDGGIDNYEAGLKY